MNKVESTIGGINPESGNDQSEDKEPVKETPSEDEKIETPPEDEINDTPSEDEKIEVDISKEVEEDLKVFFKLINKNMFTQNPDECTVAKVETASTEKLAPIIRKFRKQLKNGGASEPDAIIQEIINIAVDEHTQQIGSRRGFLDKIINPANITSPQIIKFNKFIAKALKKNK